MTGKLIDFLSVDAARFNQLRDEWRSAASSCALSKAGLRVAAVLPGYVSREYGYAFPTDRDLARDITADEKTAKRGLVALEAKHLIKRETKSKRNDRGIVIGKIRRIYLTMPEGTVLPFRPKGQSPKGQAEPKGQKRATEGTPVCPDIPDRTTPDNEDRRERRVSSYVPAREGWPKGYEGDVKFLDAFDETFMAITDGKPIGAGEIEMLVHQAFDETTLCDDTFMPFTWSDVRALRSGQTAEWFMRRAGQLIHRRAA